MNAATQELADLKATCQGLDDDIATCAANTGHERDHAEHFMSGSMG